jgi:hypothetical protein
MSMRYPNTFILAALISLAACDRSDPIGRELSRSTSPDRTFDAVITEVVTDATVSTPFNVFIVLQGKSPADGDYVLKVDKTSQPSVEWTSPSSITLRCEGGRVWQFQNFGSVKVTEQEFANISVTLNCGEHGYQNP